MILSQFCDKNYKAINYRREGAKVKKFAEIDSKFRFVIIAAKRSRELMKGSSAKINTKYKNPVKIAQEEISRGYIKYKIIEEDTI